MAAIKHNFHIGQVVEVIHKTSCFKGIQYLVEIIEPSNVAKDQIVISGPIITSNDLANWPVGRQLRLWASKLKIISNPFKIKIFAEKGWGPK